MGVASAGATQALTETVEQSLRLALSQVLALEGAVVGSYRVERGMEQLEGWLARGRERGSWHTSL